MRRFVCIGAALLVCSLLAQEGSAQSAKVTDVRQVSRTVPASYAGFRSHPYGAAYFGGGGCGCDSCGGGCGMDSYDACCETSCCSPCLLPRLVHGVGRAIHNLFSCRHGGCCSDACCGSTGSCCAAPSYGVSYGGCGGCSSCGSGGSGMPYDAGNPFLDDAIPEGSMKSPVVPKDARIYRSSPSQSAVMRSGRPVVVGPVRVSAPRPLNPQASVRTKSVKAASYQAAEPTSAKSVPAPKSRKASNQNPLRGE